MKNYRVRYLRWGRNEIQYCMNNDSREASSRYPEEGRSQSIESHNNDYSGDNAACWASNTRLSVQGRTGKRASGGICTEAGADSVCNANSNKFLTGINFVAVHSPESYSQVSLMKYLRRNRYLTFGNSDMLKEEDDGCYRELRAQSFDQVGIYIRLPDVLEPRGHCQQNFDGIFPALQSMTAIQPGSNCKNDENKGMSQNADEKKYACWPKPVNSNFEGEAKERLTSVGVFFSHAIASDANGIEREQTNQTPRCVKLSTW